MHNQFKRFAFFGSKNLENDSNRKLNEKLVKYLYKNETEKLKIKSGSGSGTGRKHSKQIDEEERRSRRKKSEELNRKKQPGASGGDVYFVSPEDMKRHRKTMQEKPPERHRKRSESKNFEHDERRSSRNREDEVAKFIKGNRPKQEDHQRLSKKEDKVLRNNSKEIPKNTSSNFLRKFFVFDKQEPRKNHRYSEGPSNSVFLPFKTSAGSAPKKLDKRDKSYDRTCEERVDPQLRKHRSKPTDVQPEKTDSTHRKKRKSKLSNPRLAFKELGDVKEEVRHKRTPGTSSRDESQSRESSKLLAQIKVKPKRRSRVEEIESSDITKDDSDLKMKKRTRHKNKEDTDSSGFAKHQVLMTHVDRTNPLRHKACLVKNTFSVIEIAPIDDAALEKKKQLKSFKKYYRYGNDHESEANSSTYHTFSDCHKMYVELSEHSIVETKKRKKKTKPTDEKQNWKVETHVADVIGGTDKCEKAENQKSKIPVLNIFESSVSPRSLKKENTVSSPNKQTERIASPRVPKTEEPAQAKVVKPFVPFRRTEKELKEKKTDNKKAPTRKLSSDFRSFPAEVKRPSPDIKRPSTDTKRSSFDSRRPSSDIKSLSTDIKGLLTDIKRHSIDMNRPSVDIRRPSTDTRRPADIKLVFNDTNRSRSNKRAISLSPPSSVRRKSIDGSIKSPSNDGSSSLWSKTTRQSPRSSFSSKSDTKLHRSKRIPGASKTFERTSTKGSLSNSTFNSMGSSKNASSFLLTKTYKDDEKLSRWQKRKNYSECIRKNLINKTQKASAIPPQVLEVRYLTVSGQSEGSGGTQLAIEEAPTEKHVSPRTEFYENDLPQPCIELVEHSKFQELFDLPADQALNEILSENYNFLKKDFSYTKTNIDKSSSSEDEISVQQFAIAEKEEEWYDFHISGTLSEISCCRKTSDNRELAIESEDHIVESVSAPGSEESGYATVKSSNISQNFFEKPAIKALFNPPFESALDSYCVEVQIETHSSNNSGLEIRSIESKSLQTSIECSHKSIQIKLSQEEMLEKINFSEPKQGSEIEGDADSGTEEECLIFETQIVEEIVVKKRSKLTRWLSSLSCIKCTTNKRR